MRHFVGITHHLRPPHLTPLHLLVLIIMENIVSCVDMFHLRLYLAKRLRVVAKNKKQGDGGK